MTDDAQAKALEYVQQWFCHNNEILWERGGHYKEEVEALTQLIQHSRRAGLERLRRGMYLRHQPLCCTMDRPAAHCNCGLDRMLDELEGKQRAGGGG